VTEARDIYGTVFKHGTAVLLARVVDETGEPISQHDIALANYTVYLLDESDPDQAQPVAGHHDRSVAVAQLIYNSLQRDSFWDLDELGYNFRHVLDVSVQPAFPKAGRSYRVVFRLIPTGGQVILVRFRLYAI